MLGEITWNSLEYYQRKKKRWEKEIRNVMIHLYEGRNKFVTLAAML